MRTSTAAAAALALALLLGTAPVAGAMTTTPNDRVFVIYVNIGWNSNLASEYSSLDFFRRIADPERKPNESDAAPLDYKPDIVLANEVPHGSASDGDWHDKFGFRNKLEEYVGGQWSWFHSDQGATAVFFRSDRFEAVGHHSWSELTGDDCSGSAKGNNEIAVKLRPFHKEANVIASSVHFEKTATRSCLAQNLARANSQIENQWGTRPLTLLGGDFNEKPEPEKQEGAGNRDWRIEDEPACWWLDFNADDNCTAPAGWYYDTVRARNWSPAAPGDICSEWTRENSSRLSNENADQCDSEKSRIDYIWARWEGSGGSPQTTDGRIEGASADRGFWNKPGTTEGEDAQTRRYSDHRAVRAVVRF
ncbi:MAG TPA: hypothetical protein VHF89_21345 [Solirubrobacteraceae bacterium]|nr:hypothetical protein [Solirubrobacteraceae bacterium]